MDNSLVINPNPDEDLFCRNRLPVGLFLKYSLRYILAGIWQIFVLWTSLFKTSFVDRYTGRHMHGVTIIALIH